MSSENYRLERMSDERFGDLKLLYENAFLTGITEDFLRQKYDTGFTKKKFFGYIAYDENNSPAAYYGIFPLFAEYKGKTILASQSGDTMTHSAHRGKGLFIRLARETFRLAREEGISFVYGFPNRQSYRGFMKLDWQHNGYMNKYKVIVPALPVSLASNKITALKKTYLKITGSVLSKYKTDVKYFENSVQQEDFIRVKHDEDYFRYKEYFKKYIISVHGRKVYLKIDNSLMVGDIERCGEKEFWQVIWGLKMIAFKTGVPVITFQVSPGTALDSFLAKKYKPEESLPVCYFSLAGDLDLSKLKFTLSDFDTF